MQIRQDGSVLLQMTDVPVIARSLKETVAQRCGDCQQDEIRQDIADTVGLLTAIRERGAAVLPQVVAQTAPTSPVPTPAPPTQPQPTGSLAEAWARDQAVGGRKVYEAAERSALINEAFRSKR